MAGQGLVRVGRRGRRQVVRGRTMGVILTKLRCHRVRLATGVVQRWAAGRLTRGLRPAGIGSVSAGQRPISVARVGVEPPTFRFSAERPFGDCRPVTCGDARRRGVAGVLVGALWARMAGAGRSWPDRTPVGSRCPGRVGRDRPDRASVQARRRVGSTRVIGGWTVPDARLPGAPITRGVKTVTGPAWARESESCREDSQCCLAVGPPLRGQQAPLAGVDGQRPDQ